jgi:hypothetical protein
MARPQRRKLGETLVEAGLIDDFQLRSALADQKRWGNRLGKTLVKLGFVEEEPLMRHLSRLMGYPLAEIHGRDIDLEVLSLLPGDMAEKHRCLPLFIEDEGASRYLYLGMEEPADLDTLDALQLRTGFEICPVLIGFRELDAGLRRFYGFGVDGDVKAEGDDDLCGNLVGPECLRHGDEALDAAPEAVTAPSVAAPATPSPDESFQVGLDSTPPVRADGGATARSPRPAIEVPTRRILQALTQVLIEKGVMTRDELVAHVKALSTRDED